MNQRIQKLAEQAKAQYCDLGDASVFKRLGLVEAVVFNPEDLEKFAELIVKECMDTISDCSMEYCTRPQIVSEIKEHFGVEE
jgi:hypothetical protein